MRIIFKALNHLNPKNEKPEMITLACNSIDPVNVEEFLGWHTGDGCISVNNRYSEYTLTGDITEEYPFYKNIVVPAFNEIFKIHLKRPVELKRYKSVGVCGIYVFNKDFVTMLQQNFGLISGKKISIKIPHNIETESQKINFLRGLYDTDGSIYFCKSNYKTKRESLYTMFHYAPKIKIAGISRILIEQVYELLCGLDFSPRIQKSIQQRKNEYSMHSVVLDRRKDVLKWLENIGFRNMKHLTKAQIWRKFGFCPPYTTLQERLKILNGTLNPLLFYPKSSKSLASIKREFLQ